MIAIGYDRVSTARQAKGTSLSLQKAAIRQCCQRNEWKLRKIYTDPGLSGKDDNRPGLQAAIEATIKAKGVLVFYDFTRFCRSIQHAHSIADRLRRSGAGLYGVFDKIDLTDDSPTAELQFSMLAALAQFQRRLNGHKVKEKNAETVARLGYRTQGRQPIGWKVVNGRRIPCERERDLVAHVRSLVDGKSQREVARILEASGRPTIAAMRGQADEVGWTARKVGNLVSKSPAESAPHGEDAGR